jgi:hypothetical protein
VRGTYIEVCLIGFSDRVRTLVQCVNSHGAWLTNQESYGGAHD